MAIKKRLIDNIFLMQEWDWEKNTLDPASLGSKSSQMPWWKCSRGHSWQSKVYNRTRGQGCPYCANKKVSIDNCLATLSPDLAAQWHPFKNAPLTPRDVTLGSARKIWWLCSNGHEWQATVYNRKKAGCPYCSNQKVLPQNSLAEKYPELALEWDSKNSLSPWDITPGSGYEALWSCQRGHRWKAKVYSRVVGSGCPYCANRQIESENSLAVSYPQISREWHPNRNGKLTPEQVAPHSGRIVWWQCSNGHTWKAAISSRTRGSGCPYCVNRLVHAGNSLKALRPDLAAQWHPLKNLPLRPDAIAPGSNARVWWKCPCGYEWKTAVYHRSAGHGCPKCSGALSTSFPEQAIYYYLRQRFPAQSRARIAGYEVDIYLPTLSIGIEYDGSYFHPPEKRAQETQKELALNQAGIRLIRIKEAKEAGIDWQNFWIFCVYHTNYRYLLEVIDQLLSMIRVLAPQAAVAPVSVDIDRDFAAIRSLYRLS